MPRSEVGIIARQMLALLATTLAVYGVLFAASLAITPLPLRSAPIDTFRAGDSVFQTPAKMIFYGRRGLSEPQPKLLLFGSSNTQVGFDREALSRVLPGYGVHNLGLGDTNIHELAQIVDLAIERISQDELDESVAVLGVWYGMFVDNAQRWGTSDAPETNIDRERYRYGLWERGTDGPIARRLAPEPESAATLLHPLFVFETVLRELTVDLRGLVFERPPRFDETVRNTKPVTEREKQSALAWRREFIGADSLSDEQYGELEALLETLDRRGIRTILVDLPIPEWHSTGLLFDEQHRDLMDGNIERYTKFPSVRYLDLRDLDDEDSFYDDAHVRPRSRQPWLDRLAAILDDPP